VVGHLARNGNWFSDQKSDFEILTDLQDSGFENLLSVDGSLYQNSGATIVQQLTFILNTFRFSGILTKLPAAGRFQPFFRNWKKFKRVQYKELFNSG